MFCEGVAHEARMSRYLLLLALLAGCQASESEQPQSPVAEQPVPERPGGIVVMGSSTVVGVGASIHDSSWVGRLGRTIDSACPDRKMSILGASGYTSWQFVPSSASRPKGRPESDPKVGVEQALKLDPRLVILQINSNDPANGYSPTETLANHRIILDSLRSHGVHVIEVGPFPRYLQYGTARQMLTLRDSLTKLVDSTSRVDVWDTLAMDSLRVKNTFTAGDAVHLSNAGHAVIHRMLIRCRTWRAVCAGGK